MRELYINKCVSSGTPACHSLQRINNLQAAYEGFEAYGCKSIPITPSSPQSFAQWMARESPDSRTGVYKYACYAAKTGCVDASNGCELWVFDCFCGGSACIAQGESVGNSFRSDRRLRSTKTSGREGCYWDLGCKCTKEWTGGLPKRKLYVQGSP